MTTLAPASDRRDDLVRRARGADPWSVLPGLLALCGDDPGDREVAIAGAGALLGVGLRTLAIERVEGVHTPEADAVRARAAGARQDAFALDDRLALARRNVAALHEVRGVDLRSALEGWGEGERGWEVFATGDGSVVRRPAGERDPRRWAWVGEQRRDARERARRSIGEQAGAVTVLGLTPPWALVEALRATAPGADGFTPFVTVVEPDADGALRGLSLIDASLFVGDERVVWFLGAGASERWEAWARSRFDAAPMGPVTPAAFAPGELVADAASRLARVRADQGAESERWARAAAERYPTVSRSAWAGRYAQRALRVLIPTTVHSTFIRHASMDLRDAFIRGGHGARVLIEPDGHTRLGHGAYRRAAAEFSPDLIVLINYPRASRPGLFPEGVPFVCWIQDEMPHLFDQRLGRAMGELDFLVGHCVRPLFERYGYAPQRSLFAPVAVSPVKFHGGAVTGEQRERLACEVAFVSHHAETPERLHERKCVEAGEAAARAVFERLRPAVESIAGRIARIDAGRELRAVCAEAARLVSGGEPSRETVTQLEVQYARPMLERVVRHRHLAWAADVCERRGWRLRVFGRGWGEHPRFSAYAAGELGHGDDLRAAYACAGVHLHLSALHHVHQRVMECAMSGGLAVVPRSVAAMPPPNAPVLEAGLTPAMADRCELSTRRLGFPIADHPALMRHAALTQRLGGAAEAVVWRRAQGLERVARESRERARDAGVYTAPWLLGDPVELSFADEAELEALIERAALDPGWRAHRSAQIADRVRDSLTHDALVERMVAMIRESVGA